MKDLDFDELDRAVNSLDNAMPVTDTSNEGSSDRPTDSQLAVPTVTTTSLPPLVVRPRTGRIMDVVQSPSSPRVPLVMPERSSRMGVTVNPISENSLNSNDPSTPPPVSTDAPVVTPPVSVWPDPIDMQSVDNNTSTTEKVETPSKVEDSDIDEDADIDRISDDIAKTLNIGSEKTMDSPFLSDAKVEKRPLGTFSSDSPTQVAPPSVPDDKIDKHENVSLMPKQINLNAPLPAELQDDLLIIEANAEVPTAEKSIDSEVITKTAPDEPATAPVTANETSTISSAPVTPPAPVAPVTVVDKPIGPVSIAQQYKEQPNTGNQSTGAIFDTKEYHKAITHTATKKSGLIWVLWIVLILIIGAGAGAAVYFFVLPH